MGEFRQHTKGSTRRNSARTRQQLLTRRGFVRKGINTDFRFPRQRSISSQLVCHDDLGRGGTDLRAGDTLPVVIPAA